MATSDSGALLHTCRNNIHCVVSDNTTEVVEVSICAAMVGIDTSEKVTKPIVQFWFLQFAIVHFRLWSGE